MARIVCFGELLLRLGAPGRERLLQTPRLEVFVGGAEANVAVGLARLGHEVDYVSIVADNPLGDAALGELRRHGVSTRFAARAQGRMGLYFLETGAIHRPSRIVYDRAGSAFAQASADAIDWDIVLAGADGLHLSGITPAIGPNGVAAARRAIDVARAARVRISFDGNFRPSLWAAWDGDAPSILNDLVADVDLLFADKRDVSLLIGRSIAEDDEAIGAAFEAFPKLRAIAATSRSVISADLHALSARLAMRATQVVAGPAQVGPIVDRIGGGDAFAVGLLHGLLTGAPHLETVRLALAAAALKHSVPGDLCLLDREEIENVDFDRISDVRR